MIEYPIHPLATAAAEYSPEALENLAKDIKTNGLILPITIYHGKILDGRNRYEACKIAGVEPHFKFLPQDAHPVEFIISVNDNRRHSSPSQRAMFYLELFRIWEEMSPSDKTPSQVEKAKLIRVSTATVSRAETILDKAPADVAKIKTGQLSVNTSYQQLSKPIPVVVPKDKMPMEALKVIAEACGKDAAKAIYDGVIPMPVKDIVRLASHPKEELIRLGRLVIVERWPLFNAERFLKKMLTPDHRLIDAVNAAIAEGGKWVGDINGFEISVKRK